MCTLISIFLFVYFVFVLQYITFLCVVQFTLQRFFIVFDDFFLFVTRSFGHFSVIVIQLTVDFFSFFALYNIVALLVFIHMMIIFLLCVCGIKLIFM